MIEFRLIDLRNSSDIFIFSYFMSENYKVVFGIYGIATLSHVAF